VATPEQKAKVLALARDRPRLWHAPTTKAKDRKRMLRLLIKDITVEKPCHQKQLVVHIRWQGGASSDLSVQIPPHRADRVQYSAAVVDRVRDLAQSLPNAEIAERLNREGHVSALSKPFTGSMIQWIRFRYQIPKVPLARPEESTVKQVAKRFGVSPHVVYYWIDRGVISARRLNAGSPYWITLDEADEQKLRDWVRHSCRIHTASSTAWKESAL
jgi:MerR HTH family regulatory protein